MERLKYFDQYVLEGLDTSVEVTNDQEDEVTISLPNDKSETKYVRRNGKIYVIGENGEEEFSENDPNYEYVKKIFKSTRFAKNQDKRNQVERISGKDDEIEDKVEDLYDKDMKKPDDVKPTIRRFTSEDSHHILDLIQDNLKNDDIYTYISLDGISEEQRDWFNVNSEKGTRIGKGEYLLPILFTDVRKKHPFKEKGDDAITNDEGTDIAHIEVKSAGGIIKFINLPDDKCIGDDIEKKHIFRCAYSILYYLAARKFDDKTDEKVNDLPCYMVLFDNTSDSNSNFKGIHIIKNTDTIENTRNKYNQTLAEKAQRLCAELGDKFGIDDDDICYDSESMCLNCDDNKILCQIPRTHFKEIPGWDKKLNERGYDCKLTEEEQEGIKSELEIDDNYDLICTINPKGTGFAKLGERLSWKIPYVYFKYVDNTQLNWIDIAYILKINIDSDESKRRYVNKLTSKAKGYKPKFDDLFKNKLIDTESDENIDKLKKEAKTLMWIYGLATGNQLLPENTIQDKDSFLTNEVSDEDSNEIDKLETTLRNKSKSYIPRIKELTDAGRSLQEIADDLHKSYGYIYAICKNNNIKFNKQKRDNVNIDVDQVRELIQQGKSVKEIAKILNCTDKDVYNVCSKNDIMINRMIRKPGSLGEDVLGVLKGGGIFTIKQISSELNINPHALDSVLPRLIKNNSIKKVGYGKYTINESFHIYTFDEMFND